MGEKMDLKRFYTSTFPSMELSFSLKREIMIAEEFGSAERLRALANKTFAILGHVHDLDLSKPFGKYKHPLLFMDLREMFSVSLQKLNIIDAERMFNPAVIPMIQKADRICTAYEKQIGLSSECNEVERGRQLFCVEHMQALMVEEQALKAFYESTKPTDQNIKAFGDAKGDQQKYLENVDKALAMLAHLRVSPSSYDDTYSSLERKVYEIGGNEISNIRNMYSADTFDKLQKVLENHDIMVAFHGLKRGYGYAFPMIQRYIKLFEAYEKRSGLPGFCEYYPNK